MTHAPRTNEAVFESVIESHLLANGCLRIAEAGFDRARAIFPETVLDFIRETQEKEWKKLEALHGAKTGEQIIADLCKWMDANGSLATLRHGFKCYGRALRVAFFKAAHGLNPELETRYAANRVGLKNGKLQEPEPAKSKAGTAKISSKEFVKIGVIRVKTFVFLNGFRHIPANSCPSVVKKFFKKSRLNSRGGI